MPATLGDVTKPIFEQDPEAHKLHIEFVVAAGQTVNIGDPVILAADGTVQLAGAAAAAYTILGVSIHKGIAGDRVTIAMRAYTIVNAEAAANSLDAGPVQLGAWNTGNVDREYAVVAGADATAKTVVCVGHNLTQATLDGDPILVALLP